ncbi:MAG: hypothetical protein SangKO_028740 [Sandaracinaceae bacterium]
MPADRVDGLLVLYDSRCPFCVRCRQWLEARAQLVPLRFACCHAPATRERFGAVEGLAEQLVVVADDGRYWSGPEAFLVCAWALDLTFGVTGFLSSRWLWPLTRALFAAVAANRASLGALLGVSCHGAECRVAHPQTHPGAQGAYR